MKTERLAIFAWALACAAAQPKPGDSEAALAQAGRAALRFEPNAGQADPEVRFVSRGGSTSLMLTGREAFLTVAKQTIPGCGRREAGCFREPVWQTETVRMHLEGGRAAKSIRGTGLLPSVTNYLIGPDPAKWQTGVPNYSRVEVQGVYDGIDLVYYGNQNRLEYDFVVAPGADPNVIRLAYDGARLRTADNGDLVLSTKVGELRQHRPLVYQISGGQRVEIAAHYRVTGREVFFELARYDRTKPLVIDPILVFATFAGGSGADNVQYAAGEGNGNFYVAGQTASANFPVTSPGTGTGSSKAFVQKYNANNQLVYSTFYGGNDGGTSGLGIAVDQTTGEAVITGQTTSTQLPLVNAYLAYNSNRIASGLFFDAFVARLNAAGNGLVLSTYLGGQGDDKGKRVAVDSTGIYVAGETIADNFPLLKPVQGTRGGSFDVFVAKLSGNQLLFGTYLGGSGIDTPWGLEVSGGAMFVAGATGSPNFPVPSGFDTQYGQLTDGFVAKINPVPAGATNATIAYSTYVGGSNTDIVGALAVDGSGNAYVAGRTFSTDFPLLGQWKGYSSVADGFITKINAAGNALVYSTYVGGGDEDEITCLAVDSLGAVHFAGFSYSGDLTGINPPGNLAWNTTAFQTSDMLIGKMLPAGNAPEYLGFYGGAGIDLASGNDAVWGLSLDNNGRLWLAGDSTSQDLQTVNPVQTFQGGFDAVVMRIDPQASTAIGVPAITSPAPGQTINVGAVTIQWGAVGGGVTGYDLEITNFFTQSVVFTGQLSGQNSTSALVNLPMGSYTVRIRACTGNAFTTCGYYAYRRFQVALSAPAGTPVLTNPTNNSTITVSTINFTWNAVAGAQDYELTIFNTPSNTIELKIRVNGLNTIYTMKSGTYRAEIRACSAICGNTGAGGSANFTVQLLAAPTVAPSGLGCSVTNVSNVNQLTCNWNAVAGADLYVIQVVQPGAGPGGGALTVAARQISATNVTFLVPNGAATVLVQACTGDGCGPYSGGFDINPNHGNPVQPILGTPIGGRTIDSGSSAVIVNFSWNRIAGDNGTNYVYRLFVQDFSRQQPALDVLSTSNFYAAFFNTASRYDALVQAIPVGGGPAITGPAQGFSTRGRNPNSPTPTATQHNSTNTGAGNVFLQWTPIPDAQGSTAGRLYQYYVARNGQVFPAATGLTLSNFVQVPLTGGSSYTAVMRVCNSGTSCTAGSNTGWGPWSDQGEGGVTNFSIP